MMVGVLGLGLVIGTSNRDSHELCRPCKGEEL